MRSEGGSFVYSESTSLSLMSSATMTRDALHCIFVRPLCSMIVWFKLCFRIDIHPLSSSLPFLHHYPPYVVWKGHLALFGLVWFLDASDPILLIGTSDTPLGQVKDKVVPLRSDTCIILWLISFRPRKPPSAFCCLYLFVVAFLQTPLCVPSGFCHTFFENFQSHRPLFGLFLDINIIILSYLI